MFQAIFIANIDIIDKVDEKVKISRRIAESTGEPRSGEFLRQRLSIEIQRGNAVSVLGTTDMPKGSDDVFFLLGTDFVGC